MLHRSLGNVAWQGEGIQMETKGSSGYKTWQESQEDSWSGNAGVVSSKF